MGEPLSGCYPVAWRTLIKVGLLQSQAIFFLPFSEKVCKEKGSEDQGDTSSRKGLAQHNAVLKAQHML